MIKAEVNIEPKDGELGARVDFDMDGKGIDILLEAITLTKVLTDSLLEQDEELAVDYMHGTANMMMDVMARIEHKHKAENEAENEPSQPLS